MSNEKDTVMTETTTIAPEDQAANAAAPETSLLEKITEFGGDDTVVSKLKELGVETLDDLADCEVKDLEEAGLKRVKARQLIESIKKTQVTPATPALGNNMAPQVIQMNNVLPDVESDDAWLTSLRTGGVLKIEKSTVTAAIRAAIAKRAGLYDVPEKLVDLMEQTADQTDEPVNPTFFELRRKITRKNYAEVFEAIPGLDGSYVTDARKKDLFNRMDQFLWPALLSGYKSLTGWYRSWRESTNDPALLVGVLTGVGGIPMTAPDISPLCDASSAMKDDINKVFRGTGVQIAAGLAYEAKQIIDTLSDPSLPALTGSVNREQMLQRLGTAVSANYPRLERDLIRFVNAFIELEEKAGTGNEAIQYVTQLWQLGNTIDWNKIGLNIGNDDDILGLTGKKVL